MSVMKLLTEIQLACGSDCVFLEPYAARWPNLITEIAAPPHTRPKQTNKHTNNSRDAYIHYETSSQTVKAVTFLKFHAE